MVEDGVTLIDHTSFRIRYTAVLLPLGFMVNRNVRNAEEGDTIVMTYDDSRYRLIRTSVIPINSDTTELLSVLLYNKHTKDLLRLWVGNYGDEISKTECYCLILEKI